MMEHMEQSRLIFDPLLVRFTLGEDYKSRDSRVVQAEPRVLVPLARTHLSTRAHGLIRRRTRRLTAGLYWLGLVMAKRTPAVLMK